MGYGIVDTSDASEAGLFAIPAFLITFRETLEAAIIVSVLLGLLEKVDLPQLKKYVWLGVLGGSILCIGAGVAVLIVVNVLKETFLDEEGIALTEGIMSIVAALLIGYVALSIGNIMGLHAKWEKKLTSGVEEEDAISWKTIFFLSFTAVVREGVETIIFFTSIGAAYPIESLPIPAIVGAVVGVILGVALYKFGGKLTIQWFFRVTMVLLVFIGAGVFTNGINSLQRAGRFGTWEPEEDRPPMNQMMWDIRSCCALESSEGWVLFRILFGYTPTPTPLEAVFYFSFHIIIWGTFLFRRHLDKRQEQGKPGLHEICCKKTRQDEGSNKDGLVVPSDQLL